MLKLLRSASFVPSCLLLCASVGCGGLTLFSSSQLAASDTTGVTSSTDTPAGSTPMGEGTGTESVTGNEGADTGAESGDTSHISCTAGLATASALHCDSNQQLSYTADAGTGAQILDQSTVGYRTGGVPLPSVAVAQTLKPSGGDDTTAIQNALNAVAKLPADANGRRGRVLLGPGAFKVSRTLTINTGGVVLEGTASMGAQATTLALTGTPTTLLSVTGTGKVAGTGSVFTVLNLPVAAGSDTLTLKSATGLQVGDAVSVTSPRNLAWITMMFSGIYPPVRDGAKQAGWGGSMAVTMARTIAAVAGNVITLDAPLGDTLPDSKYGTTTVQREAAGSWLEEFGLGHIKLQGRFIAGDVGATTQLTGVSINGAQHCWLDDVELTDFGYTSANLGSATRNITLQDVRTIRTAEQTGSAKPFDISIRGQKILVQGCSSNGSKTFYATHNDASSVGPNVVQNYRVLGSGTFEPHQRWSPGLLFDNIYVPQGGIALKNRTNAGTGQGWPTGFSLVYNSLAGTTNSDKAGMDAVPGHTLDQPPSSVNVGVGLVGPNRSIVAGASSYQSPGKPVGPPSLWAHQLWQRRGPNGLRSVVGPWHVTTADGKACLVASTATAGAQLAIADCDQAGQLGLFDITSRNLLRLGLTGLCVDAAAAEAGAALSLAACRDDDLQHWDAPSRGGFATTLNLAASDPNAPLCINPGTNSAAVLAACTPSAGPWRLLVTHLAR